MLSTWLVILLAWLPAEPCRIPGRHRVCRRGLAVTGNQILGTPSALGTASVTLTVIGMTVQTIQQIDIRFDPTRYGTLSNVQVPGFSALPLQPNNPPGVFGDLILFPSTNNQLLGNN
jgi:hypothetical protein